MYQWCEFVSNYILFSGKEGKMADSSQLSLREAEVFNHLVEGKANREISVILNISQRTVQKHLERVYKKLGVESRTAAVISFYRHQTNC